ncbi:hypothetical protein [Sulfurisphaera ohwakuensis]|uniref:hypothetical protein n=1 Tax=Sulfurisphaera ohwakuensis TaxID=69656 RepID=UPI0036F3DADC
MKLSELVEKLKKYGDVKEIGDAFNGDILVVLETAEVKGGPFDGLYISPWEFKIKRNLIDAFAIEPVDGKKVRVYLFLKKGVIDDDGTRR